MHDYNTILGVIELLWFKEKCCLSSILIVHNKGVGQEWFKGIPNVLTRNGWN